MNKKLIIFISVGVFLLLAVVTGIFVYPLLKEKLDKPQVSTPIDSKTEALMLMIEFEGTEGLSNFVNQIKEREIPGLLLVSASFVEENCDSVNAILKYHSDIELAGLDSSQPFWDVEYETQLGVMTDTKERIYECTGRNIRVFGSKYFAYDESTVKAAQELGIEYVLARGTTSAKATIYKPSEYDVKIFSVSNVSSQNWGTGSLCDYSYWAREGSASDFEKELMGALSYPKISPVSHTYIGGLKQSWNDVYVKLFDSNEVNWLTLDEFGEVDVELPFADIPVNKEVQYETPHPLVPLDQESDVQNPCSMTDIELSDKPALRMENNEIIIFHNGVGTMCIEALAFFEEKGYEYTQYLDKDDDFNSKLSEYRSTFTSSEGFSDKFGYYPIIFVEGRAFSGFNADVQSAIESIMAN